MDLDEFLMFSEPAASPAQASPDSSSFLVLWNGYKSSFTHLGSSYPLYRGTGKWFFDAISWHRPEKSHGHFFLSTFILYQYWYESTLQTLLFVWSWQMLCPQRDETHNSGMSFCRWNHIPLDWVSDFCRGTNNCSVLTSAESTVNTQSGWQ